MKTLSRFVARFTGLHVRSLIIKVPRSHRWHVSDKGRQVLGAVVQLYHHGIPAALRTAA